MSTNLPEQPAANQFSATDEAGNAIPVEVISPEKYEKSLVAQIKSEVTEQAIAQLKAEQKQLQIHGTGDKEGYKAVVSFITSIKSTAAAVENKRKALKDPFLKIGKAIDAEAKRIEDELRSIQADAEAKRKAIDDAIAAEKAAEERRLTERYEARVKRLTEMGVTFNTVTFQVGLVSATPNQVRNLEPEDFDALLAKFESELNMLKAEADRKAKEQEDTKRRLEQEKIKADNALKEAEELRAKLAAMEAEARKKAAEIDAAQAAQATSQAQTPTAPLQPASEPAQTPSEPVQASATTPPAAAKQSPSWMPKAEPEQTFTLTQSQIIGERRKGFVQCQNNLLNYIGDANNKLTRAGLIQYIQSLTYQS